MAERQCLTVAPTVTRRVVSMPSDWLNVEGDHVADLAATDHAPFDIDLGHHGSSKGQHLRRGTFISRPEVGVGGITIVREHDADGLRTGDSPGRRRSSHSPG